MLFFRQNIKLLYLETNQITDACSTFELNTRRPPLALPPLSFPPGPTPLTTLLSPSLLSWHSTPHLALLWAQPSLPQWESSGSRLEPLETVIAKNRHAGSQACQEGLYEGNGCEAGLVAKREHCRGAARRPWYRGGEWRSL